MMCALNELVAQIADPLRKVAKILRQVRTETHKRDVR